MVTLNMLRTYEVNQELLKAFGYIERVFKSDLFFFWQRPFLL